jgi:hypothetical protein
LYWENHTFPEVNYCCLQEVHSGTGNIVSDPCFINPSDVNDLHICENSACKDTGDPNGNYQWQTDIDGEDRIYYGRVDIGADEYYWSPADFDESGNVDFADYAILNTAWASVAGESDYNETCDIEDNNAIGAGDLKLFCEDWLWEKAWGDTGWMMAMNKGGEITFESSMTTFNSESVDEVSSTSDLDALMLDDLQQSLAKMPEKLKAKTRRFYDISPSRTVSSVRVKQAAVDEILKFLDKMRASGELDKSLTEQKYLEFRKAVEGFSKF